ncbi:hypothetical protein Bca52824_010741 [Brassica carinata]|uniref:Shugoshin C-terminal domain-containing protein n=1 Tax=Brassica carinata TaxID=52824 RepID=A0A8X8BB51_BRACI|nr:hypothetical protein Bca52824_010741 [Brassica carinata]
MRHSLSDITNSQPQHEPNHQETDLERSEQVNRLIKENVALVKLLEHRDKTIELSRYEVRNLREGIHKLQAQNWSLAQTNSQFLAEINLARNKVKALNHEVTCKNALLKATCCEQEKDEITQSRNAPTAHNVLETSDEESEKPSVPNRRRYIRSKSIGASTAHKIEGEKEKSETKRRQLRRKSARVRTATQEATENLFEIEDLQLTMPNNTSRQDNLTLASSHNPKKKDEDLQRRDILTRHQDCNVGRRSPVDRLFRRAVQRIHSYSNIR